jgi:hypothetical protein
MNNAVYILYEPCLYSHVRVSICIVYVLTRGMYVLYMYVLTLSMGIPVPTPVYIYDEDTR